MKNNNIKTISYGWKDKKPCIDIENHILFIGDELRIKTDWIKINKIYSFNDTIICHNTTLNIDEEYTIENFYKAIKQTYSN